MHGIVDKYLELSCFEESQATKEGSSPFPRIELIPAN